MNLNISPFECHAHCGCSRLRIHGNSEINQERKVECVNRVTQVITTFRPSSKKRLKNADDQQPYPAGCIEQVGSFTFEVFYFGKSNPKGFGLKTCKFIPRRSFVIEYVGEVVTTPEVRSRRQDKESVNYVFTVNEFVSVSPSLKSKSEKIPGTESEATKVLTTHIDATEIGNTARFINHSCEPNLIALPIRRGNSLPHICFFANRDIIANEELSISYGQSSSSTSQSNNNNSQEINGNLKSCFCGSKSCSWVLPYDGFAP